VREKGYVCDVPKGRDSDRGDSGLAPWSESMRLLGVHQEVHYCHTVRHLENGKNCSVRYAYFWRAE